MIYDEFLDEVIRRGVKRVNEWHLSVGRIKDSDIASKISDKYQGAIDAFNACRATPDVIRELVKASRIYAAENKRHENFWYFHRYQTTVEWCSNVLSAYLEMNGEPAITYDFPTVGGIMEARAILGPDNC